MTAKVILVVEDGTEYIEAFRRLADERDVELVRAGDAAEARALLGGRRFDGVFLDVVFDRTPEAKLCGDRDALRARFSGDAARVREHLERQQGFYLADALAASLPPGARVVIAHDFAGEPGRLAALREKLPALEGVDEGAPLSRVLERLLA